jgi:ATP-dependent DNA ligase
MKKTFPTLYASSSTGKTKVWRIWAEELSLPHGPAAVIVTEYGYEDSEEMQRAAVTIREGKNIGRSNATTPFEQACAEAEAKWQKKKDKKYTEGEVKRTQILLPMLAHDFKKRGHDIEWPAYVQPKLNGVRCLARRRGHDVEYISRGGKRFETLGHLTKPLLSMMRDGEVFDGELFTKELTFQQIVSAVKRQKTENPDIAKVQYWVYDWVNPKEPFTMRALYLGDLVVPVPSIVFVPTAMAFDEKCMLEAHKEHMEEGFEGTIIRNSKGMYRCDFRSSDLQKYKDFIDEEFTIIGATEGEGRAEGTVIWKCLTEEGKEFDAKPKGTEEQRRHWWEHRKEFFGKMLTVRYQCRTDENLPLFPVGLTIRDYE